jgi:PBSX family phage terminase large subunit
MAAFTEKSRQFIRRRPENDSFINILRGPVRSGKNWTMIPKIIFGLNTYNPGGERVMFGVSKETIYHNILNDVFNFVGTKGYSYNRQSGELWIGNAQWRIVGAKDEGSEKYIRGSTVGIAYGDELVKIPQTFFEMMLSRMSPEGARLYGTTNADSPYHYMYKDYINNAEKINSELVSVIRFTMRDNLSLSEAKILQFESMFKGVFKKRMIDDEWVMAEGGIYKDVIDDSLLYEDSTRPLGLSNSGGFVEMFIPIDYGTGNPTVFLHVIDDGVTYWIDREYYWDSREEQQQKTDGQYVEDLMKFRDEFAPKAQCIVDPSAASLKAEMTLKGVWHCDADNDVENGIRNTASLLAQRKIRIHKRCEHLYAELGSYVWNPNKQKVGVDEPLKQHDHAPDALRYFVQTKVPAWRITLALAA